MKRKLTIAVLVFTLCLLAALPALAADVFQFAVQSVDVYVGETVTPELLRDGRFAEGDVVYYTKNQNGAADANGTVTGMKPGQVYLVAELSQNGKVVKRVQTMVNVYRKVTKVTMSTAGLQIYEPDDPAILPLLKRDPAAEPLKDRILVVPAGKGFYPKTAVTPDDVANAHKKVTYESSDVGILKLQNNQLIGVQPGQCELTIRSSQSPEITETFHVLVTQPVKKVVINPPEKYVAAGKYMQLGVTITPDNATIPGVAWSSRNEKVATVDGNGVVTGVSKGNVYIDARTTDGTNLTASFYLTVTQDVTEITIQETVINVAAGRGAPQMHVTVLPKNANNRNVTWTSSDESIATVNAYGSVTGRRRGECTVTCTSVSNPEVSVTIPVNVIQMVTDIQFLTEKGLAFHIGESRQLSWQVFPADASIQEVTFSSRAPKVAVVDQNGIVTGLAKGQADIEARATDGSGKYRVYRVTILKPVEGINPLAPQYYAQLYDATNIKATVYPNDASDQVILWSISDESIATINSVGTSYGRIYGRMPGHVTVTATTRDGGFSSSTDVAVADYNRMLVMTNAYIDANNKIRLECFNMSREFSVQRVHFQIDCYDTQGQPIVCNTDGTSTSFNATYSLLLLPGDHTLHGKFNFSGYQETGLYGYVIVTVTGFEFESGQKYWIPEDKRVPYRSMDSAHMGEPTAIPPVIPTEETNG